MNHASRPARRILPAGAAARRLDLTRTLGAGTRVVMRFGMVGLMALVVDVGIFNAARHLLDLGPLTSKTLSVTVATTCSFLGNRSWTFDERRDRGAGTAYVLFFVFNGLALLISLACLAISSYVLGLTSPLAENISTNVVGLGLGTLFRFYAYQRWVFPARATAPVTGGTDSTRARGTGPLEPSGAAGR